ncbi:MAG: hypothetical protein AseanaTS_16300 [Candidatus Pelagadaptatus aseana]
MPSSSVMRVFMMSPGVLGGRKCLLVNRAQAVIWPSGDEFVEPIICKVNTQMNDLEKQVG